VLGSQMFEVGAYQAGKGRIPLDGDLADTLHSFSSRESVIFIDP
jgi:hypothetical protein